jgi:hypothetical protein
VNYTEKASKFVCKHARYSKDAPVLKYSVRYPAVASLAFFADDPAKLVPMVATKMQLIEESK